MAEQALIEERFNHRLANRVIKLTKEGPNRVGSDHFLRHVQRVF
jgi:hypothetical protein